MAQLRVQTERADRAAALVDTKAGLLAAETAASFSLALENSACEERLKRQVSRAICVPESAKEWCVALVRSAAVKPLLSHCAFGLSGHQMFLMVQCSELHC